MMTLVTGGADRDALKQEKPTTVKDSSGQAWPRPSQECAGGSSVDGTNVVWLSIHCLTCERSEVRKVPCDRESGWGQNTH